MAGERMLKSDRLKLAKAARDLAMECVAGTAPTFGRSKTFEGQAPCCAMGHVVVRAGFTRRDYSNTDGMFPSTAWWIVTQANDSAATVAEQHSELVFPLLSLADELESAR